jgi:hypothetical protein
MYARSFTVLVWYMYINNNNYKRYHRNRETMDTSDTCIHDHSLYWSDSERSCMQVSEIFIVSMISFIIIINNVHVPDQYSERSCIHVSEVSIVSLFLWYLLLLLLLMYMYQTSTVNDYVYMWKDIIETRDISDTCIHDRSLYWSGTCTLIIIIIIKDIIETEKQSISLTHVYKIVHCTGLVHIH